MLRRESVLIRELLIRGLGSLALLELSVLRIDSLSLLELSVLRIDSVLRNSEARWDRGLLPGLPGWWILRSKLLRPLLGVVACPAGR